MRRPTLECDGRSTSVASRHWCPGTDSYQLDVFRSASKKGLPMNLAPVWNGCLLCSRRAPCERGFCPSSCRRRARAQQCRYRPRWFTVDGLNRLTLKVNTWELIPPILESTLTWERIPKWRWDVQPHALARLQRPLAACAARWCV